MDYFNLYKELPKVLSKEEQDRLLNDMSESSKQKLIIHNLRLVKIIVDKYQAIRFEKDDCFQVGIIGLIKAVETYDKSKNFEFSTYACMCIKNEIYQFFVTMNRKKRTAFIVNIDKYQFLIDDKIRFEERIMEDSVLTSIYKEIDKLNDLDRNLLYMYYGFNNKSYTYKDLGNIFNISTSNVRYRIFKSLDIIRENLSEENVMVKKL